MRCGCSRHPERIGYLLKERVFDIAVLVDALRRITDGETVVDPTIVSRLVGRSVAPTRRVVSARAEVLASLRRALERGDRGPALCHRRTVEAHVKQIFLKLRLAANRSRTGASSPFSHT